MEVFGAVSAIITVIQTTANVVSICYNYQSGIRHHPKDVVKITHELQSLRNVLERLADLARSEDESTSVALPTLDSLNDLGGPIEVCEGELKQLEVKLAPARGRVKKVGRALVWPLMEKDVQKTLAILARQRGLFQLALTADQTTMTLAIKNATSRNEESLKTLTRRFEATALDQRNQQILQWLAPPNPSSNHNKACQTRQRETERWFIESSNYRDWKDQAASFLWLHGIPGCGKTVLFSTIVEDIASRCPAGGRNILAYYYFDFNESKKQTCDGLLRSLVAQLFGPRAEGSETMETLFTDCGEGQREPTCISLIQALRELFGPFGDIFFVFDALDECVEISAVISFIEEIRGWHNDNLHILVTSRKEVVIERGFRSLITDQVRVQNFLVDADIRLLVRECLRNDPELSRWSETVKAEIEKTLYEGSKGMFRWTVCQLDTLRKCIKPSALRKALALLPKLLDDTYERILCNIDQEHAEDALKVLQWLAFSARPLGAQEVAEATAITLHDAPTFDPEDRLRHPTDIMAICSSLISISSRPINMPFEPSVTENSPLQSPSPDPMSKSEYDCSIDSTEIRDISSCVDENLESSSTNPLSVNDDSSSIGSLPETEPSDENGHTDSIDPTDDHLHHYEMEEKADGNEDLKLAERLYHASRLGLPEICKILLEQGVGADPPTQSTTGLVKSLSTPLQIAAHKGNEIVVRLLLDHGANVNQRSVHASTLDYAVAEGHESVVCLLLERGAQVTIQAASPYYGLRGLSSLVLAARAGNAGIVKLVLDNGTYPQPRESYSEAFQEAVKQGHHDVADLLLQYGASANYLTNSDDSEGSDVEYFDVEV